MKTAAKKKTAQTTVKTVTVDRASYESNPFLSVIKSLITILTKNPVSNLLLSLLGLIFLGGFYLIMVAVPELLGTVGGTAVSIFVGASIALLAIAILAVVAAQIIVALASYRKQVISYREAFEVATDRIVPFIGLTLLSVLIIVAGLFLLIIPGIYLFVRLSLSMVVFFEEELSPVAALKRSWALTRGNVTETLGAIFASSVMMGSSYGLLSGPVSVAPLVGRYFDFISVEGSESAKPAVHRLNYLPYLILPIIIAIAIVLTLTTAQGVNEKATEVKNQSTLSDY